MHTFWKLRVCRRLRGSIQNAREQHKGRARRWPAFRLCSIPLGHPKACAQLSGCRAMPSSPALPSHQLPCILCPFFARAKMEGRFWKENCLDGKGEYRRCPYPHSYAHKICAAAAILLLWETSSWCRKLWLFRSQTSKLSSSWTRVLLELLRFSVLPRSERVQEELEFKKNSTWSTTLGLRPILSCGGEQPILQRNCE